MKDHLKHEANVKVNHALYWPAGGDSFSLKKDLHRRSLRKYDPTSQVICDLSKHFSDDFLILFASF